MKNVINGKDIWDKYWTDEGYFKLFDIGSFDKKKTLNIHGRNDDVINIRGHRIGTGEIESVVLKTNRIIETCAIPVPDKIEGNKIVLFVVTKKISKKKIRYTIEKSLIESFGSFAIPKDIFFVNYIP